MKFKEKILFLTLILIFAFPISSGLSCGSSCLTESEVEQETTNYDDGVSGAKCLFIYNGDIYKPLERTIRYGMHEGDHFCGADVTGEMKRSHSSNPKHFLTPYICAPLCEVEVCDFDKDEFEALSCGGPDCDDTDNSQYPGADEYCNGEDDDCDSLVDEDDALDVLTWYEDADSDFYGNASSTDGECNQPSGYVADDTDCNDDDDSQYPGADEYCNGEDDDCDSLVDEDDALDVLTWYEDADSDFYGNASSTDDECNQPSGYVADDTDCNDGDGAISPGEAEICGNSVDEDCSGSVNNGCGGICDSDNDGHDEFFWCLGPNPNDDCDDEVFEVHPGASEICDRDVDNDCNISTPDGYDEPFYGDITSCGKGECSATGSWQCNPLGQMINTCSAGEAITEFCDGKDNDCDDETDESLDVVCGSAVGECKTGFKICTEEGEYGSCAGEVGPIEEVCDINSLDEDCDGEKNEGCSCEDERTQDCGETDVGECSFGSQTCSGGRWGPCENEIVSAQEIDFGCDGKDNDCDGDDDNGLTIDVDEDGFSTLESCEGTKNDCLDSNKEVHPDAIEICWDGVDNNCNGKKNEGCFVNTPPELTFIGDQSIDEGEEIVIVLNATDFDNDTLTYNVDKRPERSIYKDLSHTLKWIPAFNMQGTYVVNFSVSDGTDIDFEVVTITVKNVTGDDEDGDEVPDASDKCLGTPRNDEEVNKGNGCRLPKSNKFDSNLTTNFSLVNDLLLIEDLSIGIWGKGRIQFINEKVPVLTYNGTTYNPLDLSSIRIEDNLIGINTSDTKNNYSLFNKSAVLTFYNVDFTDPMIMRDGVECTDCVFNGETTNTGGVIGFIVPGFSIYTIEERPAAVSQTMEVQQVILLPISQLVFPAGVPTSIVNEVIINLDEVTSGSEEIVIGDLVYAIYNGETYSIGFNGETTEAISVAIGPEVGGFVINKNTVRLLNLDSISGDDIGIAYTLLDEGIELYISKIVNGVTPEHPSAAKGGINLGEQDGKKFEFDRWIILGIIIVIVIIATITLIFFIIQSRRRREIIIGGLGAKRGISKKGAKFEQ